MTIDMDKFLICGKLEKTIYFESYGFITIQCIPENIEVRYRRYGSYWDSNTCKTAIDNIYVKYEKSKKEKGSKKEEINYKKFSFNEDVDINTIVVKIGDTYYSVISLEKADYNVKLSSGTNPILLSNLFGRKIGNSKDFKIKSIELKEVLQRVKWGENEEEKLEDIENINYFVPGTKVFVNREGGGEGIIVRLKNFCFIEKKAIFEVKLYDGRKVEENLFGETKKDSYGREEIVKNLKAIVKKDYVQKSELQILNDSLCEDKLNPFVRCIPNGLNIYWQPVEKAAGYTVELYSWWEESVADKLYLMEKRSIERNIFYATFINLSHGMYYVRVIAEDRKGEKIAVNKAINMKI